MPPENEGGRRRLLRAAIACAALLMLWSVMSAPPLIGQEQPQQAVQEPSDLSAYATFADATPLQLYFDHQLRLIPLGPAVAHSQSDVSMPSTASSIAWLADMGIANGLHGTSTGNRVPTEASAQQPSGEEREEFKVAGGPIGHEDFMVVGAGRARAEARHGDVPRGYAAAHLAEVTVLPAAGSPMDPGGTYDPDARFPGQTTDETDPAPRGRMAILSIGSVASTSESFREGSKVVSVGVAELKEINIGNRTSDNRCTNCIRIDSLRAEAYAEASGKRGTSKAAYRVTGGRACRRGLNTETGAEEDRCLPLDPRNPQSSKGLQSIDELAALNEQFEKPFWIEMTNGAVDYMIGIRIHVGSEHEDPSRAARTSTPPEDVRRNYAYPRKTSEDRDAGEVAKAVAEAMDVEIWTITTSQLVQDGERRIAGTPAAQAIRELDQDDETPGLQIDVPGPAGDRIGTQTVPIESIAGVRRLHLALGVARANAVARPGAAVVAPDDAAAVLGTLEPPTGAPPVDTGAPPAEAAPAPPASAPSLGTGPLKLRINWASARVKPWPPYDMAKAIASIAMAVGVWLLARRRLLT